MSCCGKLKTKIMNDNEAKNIFKKNAEINMVYYNEKTFKNTHNNLYKNILESIKEAYRLGKEQQ